MLCTDGVVGTVRVGVLSSDLEGPSFYRAGISIVIRLTVWERDGLTNWDRPSVNFLPMAGMCREFVKQ